MSFVDHMITRRHFEARYRNVGRVMLFELADMYGLDPDRAELWADEIDRDIDNQIAAASPLAGSGIAGAAARNPAAPVTSLAEVRP